MMDTSRKTMTQRGRILTFRRNLNKKLVIRLLIFLHQFSNTVDAPSSNQPFNTRYRNIWIATWVTWLGVTSNAYYQKK
jgi:hypothetical protein